MKKLNIDIIIEQCSDKKTYKPPQLHVMGKMNKITLGKSGSRVDFEGPGVLPPG